MKNRIIVLALLLVLLSASSAFAQDPLIDEGNKYIDLKGAYGMSFGLTTDEFIWKDANANYQEKNFRYVYSPDMENTYDKRIFDRLQYEITARTDTPWTGYTEIVLDPWTVVGRASETVHNAWGDTATVHYRFWEATGKVINDTVRTSDGNSLGIPEMKVRDGKVEETRTTPSFWGSPAFTLSKDNSVDIDYFYRPVRKLWFEYKQDPIYVKIFPMADQADALTSDDPLKLSNNHAYWAPSPWLYNFDPGMQFSNGAVTQPRWDNSLPFFAQDSNRNFLTFLRGATFVYDLDNAAELRITTASPMSIFDYYEHVDTISTAARLKLKNLGPLVPGLIYTQKTGIAKQDVKATNNTVGADFKYYFGDNSYAFGEFGFSYADLEYSNLVRQGYWGVAYTAGVTQEAYVMDDRKVKWDFSYTAMGPRFEPGLSDYRDTREDRDWGRHIMFEPVSMSDQYDRIGNSVDQNRYVIGGSLKADIIKKKLDLYVNMRNVHQYQTNKFIENIFRVEPTAYPHEKVTVKGLFLSRKYPDTMGQQDPLIKDRITDEPWKNFAVVDEGKEVHLMTFGTGAKVDVTDQVSVYGIYEATNDPQNFPRGVNSGDAFMSNFAVDDTDGYISRSDLMVNRVIEALNDPWIFGQPPYDGYYNLWKGKVVWRPLENVSISFTHAMNTNRNYAALLDDNHTHDAIDLMYRPFEKLNLRAGYSISRIMNIARARDTQGRDMQFRPHHNLYAQAEWDVKKDHVLTAQFGEAWIQGAQEGGVFASNYPSTRFSVLDTRSIFRVYYQGKF